ncbi:MAG: GNAT family N-acetyltransferase [Actinobacteria bacterium]|nr:GNAT family N-acetyltransferase [Actinomycetota bacterium]
MQMTGLAEGHEQAVVDLFNRAYGRPLSAALWRWRFLQNPVPGRPAKLMWDGDRLVGHYAVSPAYLRVGEQSGLGSLSMTTMTDPDYAGRGVFVTLASELYQELRDRHEHLAVWGFPNLNSHYGFVNRLGWSDLLHLPMFVADADLLAERCGAIGAATVTPIAGGFSAKHTGAAESLLTNRITTVERRPEVLDWRFFAHPVFRYDAFEWERDGIHYYMVARLVDSLREEGETELNIVECRIPPDRRLLGQLLLGVLGEYINRMPKRLNMILSVHDPLSVEAERLGFIPLDPVFRFGVLPLRESEAEIADPRRWRLSMSDSDIF